ncbi:hypothetical protein [Nocardia sp. NPDC059239]|uniref:hypothetical protein n=1 Tax=unclassified Nocardia TaxID=2637762 RepID=UPI0036CAE84A
MTAVGLRGLDIALVGIGFHGRRIGELLVKRGANIVAAVDRGDAGRALSEVIEGADDAVIIQREVAAAFAAAMRRPVIAVLAISGPVDAHDAVLLACLDHGVNAVTLETEVFDPSQQWRFAMDERARAAGVSVLATGIQDLWWVQLPALVTNFVADLHGVDIDHIVGLGDLSKSVGEVFQLGADVSQFAAVEELLSQEAAILGAALRVLARRIGLRAGAIERQFEPVIAETVLPDGHGGTIPAGSLAGAVETIRFQAAGVEFTGRFISRLLPSDADPSDTVILRGDPDLRLEHRPFPGARLTDAAVVARLVDVVNADPGVLDPAHFPPSSPALAGGGVAALASTDDSTYGVTR